MVDVTKDNFAAELTRFEAAVADPLLVFIAFDFEMTGIGPPGASFAEFHDYADSPAEVALSGAGEPTRTSPTKDVTIEMKPVEPAKPAEAE